MGKSIEHGLYNGKGVVNEIYGKKSAQTRYVPKTKKSDKPTERDIVTDKMLARMKGESPMGFTYQNANGNEYEVFADKRYRFTDKDGKISQIWDGKYVTQDAIDYCNANGIEVSEEKQFLYATLYDEDGFAKNVDFSFISLYDLKYNNRMMNVEDAKGNKKAIQVKDLKKGDFIFYSGGKDGKGELTIWNPNRKKHIDRSFSEANNLGVVYDYWNVYVELVEPIECIKGRRFNTLERDTQFACVLRTTNDGDYYIKPVDVKSKFSKLLGILTGVTFLTDLASRFKSAFSGIGKEDKEMRETYKSLDGQYEHLRSMVKEDNDRIQELKQKIERATGASATEEDFKPIVAHSEGIYSETLRKFFVGMVEADIDVLKEGDDVYAKFTPLNICVGENGKTPIWGKDNFSVTNFTKNARIGTLRGKTTIKDSSGAGRKLWKVELDGNVNRKFCINPAVADASGKKPTNGQCTNTIVYVDDGAVQDFSPDTREDVIERKILGGVISAWNKTVGYYINKNYGKDSKECKDNFITPLMNMGYGGSVSAVQGLLDTLCDEKNLGAEPEALWENCFRKLGWVNDLSYNKDGFYSLYEYDIWFDELKDLYDRDEVANYEIIELLKQMSEIYDKAKKNSKGITNYPRTLSAIRRIEFKNDVASICEQIKSVFKNSKAIIDAIDEARTIKNKFSKDGEIFQKNADYEVKIGKQEDEVRRLGNEIESAEKRSNDESLSLTERETANDFVLNNYESFEKADEYLEKLRQEFNDWKDDVVQPLFDRLDELAGVCPKCAKIDNKTRSKYARQQYKAIKKELKDYFKDTYGKGWRKKFKAKKIELRNAKYEITRGKYQTWWSKFGHACTSAGMLPCRNIIQAMMMLNLGRITTMTEEIYNKAEAGNKDCKKYYDDFLNKWYSIGGNKDKFTKWVKKYGKAKPVIENMGDIESGNLEKTFKSQNLDISEIANAEEGKLNAIGGRFGYDKEQCKALQTICQYYNAFGVDDYVAAQISAAGGFWQWLGVLITKAFSALSTVLTVVGGILSQNDKDCGSNVPFTGDEDVEGSLGAMQLLMFNNAIKSGAIKNITQEEVDKITALIEEGSDWTDAVVKVHGGSFFTDESGNLCYKNPTSVGTIVAVGVCVLAVVGIAYVLLSDKK